MSNSFSVFCLYADDVRQEVSGKSTYVGTYMGELIASVPAVPSQLPRLVVSIFVNIPKDRDFQRSDIEVLWDDHPIQTVAVTKEQLAATSNTATTDDNNGRVINAVMVMEPMVLPGNGRIGVRVKLDDEVVMGNGLKVTLNVLPPTTAH